MTGYLTNGTYYNEGGVPDGEPLVFVHGTGFNTDVFDPVFPFLGHRYRVIAYDRRGYGRSYQMSMREWDSGWNTKQVDDLRDVLDGLNAVPANILAWSAGGIYAAIFAARYPKYVRHLILYEPPLYKPSKITLSLAVDFSRLTAAKSRGRNDDAVKIFLRMVFGYDGGGNSFDTLPEHMLNLALRDSAVFVEELNRIDNSAAWNNLPNVRVPLTFLVGERSIPLFRNITAGLLESIAPNASVINIPGGNHFAHVDMPDVFAAAVLQALQ